jgi:hypothetical protein
LIIKDTIDKKKKFNDKKNTIKVHSKMSERIRSMRPQYFPHSFYFIDMGGGNGVPGGGFLEFQLTMSSALRHISDFFIYIKKLYIYIYSLKNSIPNKNLYIYK